MKFYEKKQQQKNIFQDVSAHFTIFLKKIWSLRDMVILYNESHHIPTGGFIYDLYSLEIIGIVWSCNKFKYKYLKQNY